MSDCGDETPIMLKINHFPRSIYQIQAYSLAGKLST